MPTCRGLGGRQVLNCRGPAASAAPGPEDARDRQAAEQGHRDEDEAPGVEEPGELDSPHLRGGHGEAHGREFRRLGVDPDGAEARPSPTGGGPHAPSPSTNVSNDSYLFG